MVESKDNMDRSLAGQPIVIDEKPLVLWDLDHERSQVVFLESIDPTYFRYLAAVHEAQLEGDNSLNAAVALRVTYSHAIESLFAFIGAAVQAPRSPAAWLLMYKNADLKNLVERISDRKPFLNKLGLERADWPEVANALLPWSTAEDDCNELRAASSRLWKSLARRIVDDRFTDEYNSLKHGFRVRSGEWFLNIGAEDVPGTPPPPDRMRRMASSPFGSTFLRALPVKKHNWSLEEQRVNWNPSVFAKQIPLIAASIDNVLAFLKHVNGVPMERIQVAVVEDVAVSQALSDPDHSSSFRFAIRQPVDPDSIPSPSKDEILAAYLRTPRTRSDPQESE